MGVLTDFVVADLADAGRIGECAVPSRDFGGIDAKGVDQIMMGTLYAILSGTPHDPRFLVSQESFLYTASDEGPWVQLVPQDMVIRLSNLPEDDVSRVADEWCKTEEFDPKHSRWAAGDVQRFLREIAALSRKAVAENKSLLMWTSL
jgi:hypothetical protein